MVVGSGQKIETRRVRPLFSLYLSTEILRKKKKEKGPRLGRRWEEVMLSKGVGSLPSSRVGVLFLLVVVGCSCSHVSRVQPPLAVIFPPQRAMESGNYAEFVAENERALAGCKGGTGCDVALFNLGFAYAYSQSPYHNPSKALPYF